MLNKVRELKREAKGTKAAGFTIIEVMIVLAIAGLIMAIVFVAIPQLQRNTRNTTRRDVINRIKTEVDNYATNNNGSYPTADTTANTTTDFISGFKTRYLSNVSYNDPQSGSPMVLANWGPTDAVVSSSGNVGTVYYATGRICANEGSQAGNGRNYVVMSQLEGGAIYCVDNH